jgi:hypothetical protein
MMQRSTFRLDCTPIIPACGFECSKCLEEMASVFAGTEGVSKFYMEEDGVAVLHDSQTISVERLIDIFKSLPSFHESRFVPTLTSS